MAKDKNCSACSELQEYSPDFVLNGVTDAVEASLENNTGFNPTSGHDDCKDLNDANDCLIGNMEDEVDAYEVCDWKTYMKQFVYNLWTVLKAIITSICGIWKLLNCLYDGIKNLVDILNNTTQGSAFVRYFRDNGRVSGYWWTLEVDDEHTIDVYMDADAADYGHTPADRDYVVNIANCTNIRNFTDVGMEITYYASDDTRSVSDIRDAQAQHAAFNAGSTQIPSFSWTTSGSVLIRKGAHVKINVHVSDADVYGDDYKYRLHQFVMTWLPVSIDSSIDIDDVLKCDDPDDDKGDD